jgi:hypothetical protein
MKLISMWEPWATLYVRGLKRIETRGWATSHRGWVAIHACQSGLTRVAFRRTIAEDEFHDALAGLTLHPGCILGAVRIVDCRPTREIFKAYPELETRQQRAFGNYADGRFGLLAAPDVFPLEKPIPFKSRQGKLLDLPAEIAFELRRQLESRPLLATDDKAGL